MAKRAWITHLLLLALLLGAGTIPVVGQDGEKKSDKEDKKTEAPASDDSANKEESSSDEKASGEEEEEDPLTKIFGEGGMDLNAGTISTDIDPETGEMKTMHIVTGVKIISELMNVECDDLLIDMQNQKMVAKGKVVNFKMNDVEGTCGRLTYDMESKKTLLEGKPKPLIRQKDAKGRITQTSANIITMVQNEKTNNVNWEGNVEFKVIPSPEEKKAKDGEGEKEAPTKIDEGSVSKIRPPSIDGK